MAKYTTEMFQIFEDAYLKIISKPTIDMQAHEIVERGEVVQEMSLKMMTLETAHMSELHAAIEVEGSKMEHALAAMEKATEANTDYMTLLHSVDHAMHIMNNFFLLLF